MHVILDLDGVLESFCQFHDPAVKLEKKESLKRMAAAESAEKFKVGTEVLSRIQGSYYEGIVTSMEAEGCLVQCDGQAAPVFAPWIALKPRPAVEQVKEKEKPVYCSPEKKKSAVKSAFLDDNSYEPSAALVKAVAQESYEFELGLLEARQ